MQLFEAGTIGCKNRMCLAAMLAVEQETLPEGVRLAVRELFVQTEGWLTKLLDQGRAQRKLQFKGSPALAAQAVFSLLEGALLTARTFGDCQRFEAAAGWILGTLSV